jgi:hypothetical protein
MRYLIDGYNLLHAMGLLHGRAGPHGLEKARLGLLGRLHGHFGTDAANVTVVFDATSPPPGVAPDQDYQGIHVRFAVGRGRQADDLIEDLIRGDSAPRGLTVVSDDRRIQVAARRRRCPIVGCNAFLDLLLASPTRPNAPEADGPAKPEGPSGTEAQHWLREFADLEEDPRLREAFGPDFFRDEKN